jgi:hypothetical protein
LLYSSNMFVSIINACQKDLKFIFKAFLIDSFYNETCRDEKNLTTIASKYRPYQQFHYNLQQSWVRAMMPEEL